MQIIPTNSTSSSFGFFGSIGADAGSSFMDAMTDALDAVADGDYSSATAALSDENRQPLVESPYTRHTSDGVTYTLSEVCFTKQELQDLRQQLLKEGAPVETLKQFDILASQPDGATLAQVMASLMGSGQNQFSEDDAQAITALLGQIDPTGQLAADSLELMRQGNGGKALELIQNALGDMGSDMGIDIDPYSLLALGRGLGLNQGSLNNLVGALRGQSVTVNAAQFDQLMQPAKNQFLTEAANADKLNAALEKTLKPIISRARDRMEKEEAASTLQSRRVEQSKILIDRTVQQNSRDMLDKTVTGEAAEERQLHGSGLETAQEQFRQLKDGQALQKDENARNARNAQNLQGSLHAQSNVQEEHGEPVPDNGTGQNFMDSRNQDKPASQGWQSLLDKVTTKPVETGNFASRTDSVVYSMLQGNLFEQATFMENEMGAPIPTMPQQLANQVEQGILTAMRDGSTRLDLQLHPAELGTIAITLVARNGEITAQLKSEKSETAELMTRQLDTIRVNLEQQGLKVDKIEVQLENRGSQADNAFGDLGQHNARQEENAFRQEVQRLRNLANVRNVTSGKGENTMAQNMHMEDQTARYADQGLHVIA